MGDDEGTQPPRRHRDTRDAGGTRQPASGQQRDEQVSQPGQGWQEIIELLNKVKDNLTEEKEGSPQYRILPTVEKAIRRVNALQKRYEGHTTQGDNTKTQLDRIEAGVNEIRQEMRKGTPLNPGASPAQGRSWAVVAAQAAHTAKAIATPQRTTVRVRLEESQGREPGELLEIIKKTIPSAYAVRNLRSGDVDVHVPSQATKDQILNGPDAPGCKILRKDYLIEIPGVPLRTPVASGTNANNTELIHSICNATKRLVPGITIGRIRWLHAPGAPAKRKGAAGSIQKGPEKTRGTLVIGVPTQAIQQRVIKSGIIIESQLFEARLFDNSLVVKQCFRCSQWGHTQSACGKQAKCAYCAGAHDTSGCPKERVSCVNCGKTHKAWQREVCKTFHSYLEGIQVRRMALLTQTLRLRDAGGAPAPQQDVAMGGFTIVTRKRGRQPTPPPGPTREPPLKRGPGRPSFVETARRDVMQSMLQLGAGGPKAGRTETSEEPDADMADPIYTQDEEL
jgi:hypothetical protein